MTNIATSAVQKLSSPSHHARMIADLVEEFPAVRTDNFWKALRELPDAEYVQWLMETDKRWLKAMRFIPDAFAVHVEEREIVLFEVVVSHDITQDKFERMADLAFALDEDCYSLNLIRVDPFNTTAYNLFEAWIECQRPGCSSKNWKAHRLIFPEPPRLTSRDERIS